MKKTIVSLVLLACALFCIGNYFYHTIPYQFKIEGAHAMKILSGTTGESIEVSDPDVVAQITEMINSREFTRGSKEAIDGYSYTIAWYDKGGGAIEILYLLDGGSTIIKAKGRRHYHLTERSSPVDFAYLDALFEVS